MNNTLSTLIRQTTDIIDYESAVPVNTLELTELGANPIVASFHDGDMIARIQRKVSYRVTPLDITAAPLEFSEEEIEVMGPTFDEVVIFFTESEARMARFRKIMDRMILWVKQGKSVEAFLQTLD